MVPSTVGGRWDVSRPSTLYNVAGRNVFPSNYRAPSKANVGGSSRSYAAATPAFSMSSDKRKRTVRDRFTELGERAV